MLWKQSLIRQVQAYGSFENLVIFHKFFYAYSLDMLTQLLIL